jgi:hypothetical protein
MNDEKYMVADMQQSLDRASVQVQQLKCDLDNWRNMAHRLADIVKATGCYTYPTYLAYLELVDGDRK